MIRKEIMDMIEKSMEENKELLSRLANEDFSNNRILEREKKRQTENFQSRLQTKT